MTSNEEAWSKEDKEVMALHEQSKRIVDSRYMIQMPWNVDLSSIDSNYKVAKKRAEIIKRKLMVDETLREGTSRQFECF